MATQLIRKDLRPLYDAATNNAATDVHPGLLLQRGLAEHVENDPRFKTEHIERVCGRAVGKFYRRAYDRWRRVTDDATRFRSVVLKIETRLFIGLTGGGMLETGCRISHSYGTPYIPGSSVKGVMAFHARDRFGQTGGSFRKFHEELFGTQTADTADGDSGALSGLLAFHDAWWVPGSAKRSLVQEVVTSHHPRYYDKEGAIPATDFDSPIPNAQIAIRGEFLFVIEAPAEWLDLAERMLVSALTTRGASARTRAGYGLFAALEAGGTKDSDTSSNPGREWVDSKIAELSARPGVQAGQALRGKALAETWSSIDDPSLKQAALAHIRARWQKHGWWDVPQGGAARKAKAIYDAQRPDEEPS